MGSIWWTPSWFSRVHSIRSNVLWKSVLSIVRRTGLFLPQFERKTTVSTVIIFEQRPAADQSTLRNAVVLGMEEMNWWSIQLDIGSCITLGFNILLLFRSCAFWVRSVNSACRLIFVTIFHWNPSQHTHLNIISLCRRALLINNTESFHDFSYIAVLYFYDYIYK